MKKLLLTIATMIFCCSNMFGQQVDKFGIPDNSLTLQAADAILPTAIAGIGVGIGVAIGASMAAVISGGHATIDGPQFKGITPFFSLGLEHHFPDTRWSVGPEVGYWYAGLVNKESYQHFNFVTLNAAGKLYYKPAGICKLYGGLNLGAGMVITSQTPVVAATKAEEPTGSEPAQPAAKDGPGIIPTIQFNPIGMRLGSENIAFVAELGFGYKGIIQLGLNMAL